MKMPSTMFRMLSNVACVASSFACGVLDVGDQPDVELLAGPNTRAQSATGPSSGPRRLARLGADQVLDGVRERHPRFRSNDRSPAPLRPCALRSEQQRRNLPGSRRCRRARRRPRSCRTAFRGGAQPNPRARHAVELAAIELEVGKRGHLLGRQTAARARRSARARGRIAVRMRQKIGAVRASLRLGVARRGRGVARRRASGARDAGSRNLARAPRRRRQSA